MSRISRKHGRAALCVVLALSLSALAGMLSPSAAGGSTRNDTAIALTVAPGDGAAAKTDADQGFSVESADFAHGFLTKALLAGWFQTLGAHGVLRLGGYSMDLVWPAFGPAAGTPAPSWAIGGTVDQSDFDKLAELVDATGWKVTLGAPLVSVRNGDVSMDQVVAEVRAAEASLGDHLLSVEVGNEYDAVTGLTTAKYYAMVKQYHDAIAAAAPDAEIKMTGPSQNTSTSNARLRDFVNSALADTTTTPQQLLSELTSHWYPTTHCGSGSTTVAALMSSGTFTTTRTKLQGIMAEDDLLTNVPSVINETNSTGCSGMPGVSNSYASALWSLDYLLQAADNRISRLQLHTNTAAVCGDLQDRDSPNYPISYRYYGAFCGADQAALAADQLSAAPLYYGMWAFSQIPSGTFDDLDLPDGDLDQLRAYAVQGDGTLTMVLINVQDPAQAAGGDDTVTVSLPTAYSSAHAVTLASSAPGGLESTDATGVSLGGRTITSSGAPTGALATTPVPVDGTSATVTVHPGTAQILTFG